MAAILQMVFSDKFICTASDANLTDICSCGAIDKKSASVQVVIKRRKQYFAWNNDSQFSLHIYLSPNFNLLMTNYSECDILLHFTVIHIMWSLDTPWLIKPKYAYISLRPNNAYMRR